MEADCKIPKTTIVIKSQPGSQEIEDSGSGARRRRADTTHRSGDSCTTLNRVFQFLKDQIFLFKKSGSLEGVSYFDSVVAHAMSISIAYLLAWQSDHFILKLSRWTE